MVPAQILFELGSLRKSERRADVLCAGEDSNLRRPKPADLQSALVDRLSTDAKIKNRSRRPGSNRRPRHYQ